MLVGLSAARGTFMVKQLLTSKKFWLTIVAIIVWVAGRFGLDVSSADLEPIVIAIGALVVGQGFADSGKEAARITAAASNNVRSDTQP